MSNVAHIILITTMISKTFKPFNVIHWDTNGKVFEPYDVMPLFIRRYREAKKKPKTIKEVKTFIEQESMFQYWSRCEYEILLSDFPSEQCSEKWDIHKQVMMNLDIITQIFMENLKLK